MDGQISDNTISKHYGIKTTEYVSLVDANGYIGKANFPMIIDQIQRYATFSTSDSLANNNFINIYSSYDELEKVSNKYYDDLIKEANKKYGKTEPNDIGVYEWKTDDFSYRINRNVSADHVQISESIFSRNR